MRKRTIGALLLPLAFVLPLTIRAEQDRNHNDRDRDDRDRSDRDHHDHNVNTPVRLLGVVPVPGNPITSADIGWVDPVTERYCFADRSNSGVDIIDAENNFFVGRVTGMAGPLPSGGGNAAANRPRAHQPPPAPDGALWGGRGDNTTPRA